MPIAHVDGSAFRIRYANPGFLRAIDRSAEEVAGAPLVEVLAVAGLAERLQQAATTSTIELVEDVHYEAGRERRCASLLIRPLLRSEHEPAELAVHLIASPLASEVSDLRDANEQLLRAGLREQEVAERARRSAAELMALVGNMAEGITVLDAAGDIVFLNRAGREILGATSSDDPRSIYDRCVFVQDDGGRLSFEGDLVPRLLREQQIRDEELSLMRHDDAVRRIVVNGRVVFDASGAIVLAIIAFRDVSALRELEETKQLYFALISHDLRGPLSAAAITAAALERHGGDAKKAKAYAQRIQKSLARMDQMLRDLLDVQRLRAGEKPQLKLSTDDLVHIAREVASDLRAPHGDRFVLAGAARLPGRWDVAEVRRALWNLASNAAKYGSETSPIVITVEQRGDRAYVHVHNEGPGISGETRERLFAPFARGAAPTLSQGWGLGLTLVRGCAESHGGHVHVDSDEERGTTFTLELPIATAPLSS